MKTPSVTVQVLKSPSGACLSINDRRIAGSKPVGIAQVIYTFTVPIQSLKEFTK